MAKPNLKKKAILLRKKGLSYKEILQQLPVAKSTLSCWLRNVPLSKRHQQRLDESNLRNRQTARALGTSAVKEKYRKRREGLLRDADEQFGRLRMDQSSLALVGTALYWAEGSKGRNTFRFCNSDPEMVLLFMRWLRETLGVPDDLLSASINAYLNYEGTTYDDIREYWSDLTGIPEDRFGKPTLHRPEEYTGSRKTRLKYGILTVLVCKNQPYRARYSALVKRLGKDVDFVENA